jgi:hypothetical protein
VLSAPSPRRKSAPASANCMCPVAGHRLRIVFESHANRCDRLAIIPVQCRERSCTARPRAGAREIPATSSFFHPEAIKSCKNPPSRATLFHFLGLLDAFGWLTDGLQSLLAVRIHLAPPASLQVSGFSSSLREKRAFGRNSALQVHRRTALVGSDASTPPASSGTLGRCWRARKSCITMSRHFV